MMSFPGLWADGWFYLSAGGFLASAILFIYFLSNYRAAVEAEDEEFLPEPEAESEAQADQPSPILHEKSSAPFGATIVSPDTDIRHAPPAVSDARAQASSPAPVLDYREVEVELKNMDSHLGQRLSVLESELGALKSAVDSEAEQGRQILKRLNELSALKDAVREGAEKNEAILERVAELARALSKKDEERPAPAPAPAQEPVVESKPQPVLKPAVEKKPELAPTPRPDPAAVEASKPQTARKTPVWPI
ncbi:MAG TPA: hypothetical protein VNK24_05015, partial [Elusimicrobiota bacterium]|nr:hypothetical protein [Elusimicrobiota bacterium]